MSRVFNGTSSDHLDGAAGITQLTGNWTIACWVKRANTGEVAIWSRWLNSGAQRQLYFKFGPADQLAVDVPFIKAVLTGNTAVTDTSWHHVAARRNGNDWSVWLDGNNDKNVTDTTAQETSGAVKVGYDNNGRYFNGSMYGLGAWSAALDDTTMAALAVLGTLPTDYPTNLVHSWVLAGDASPEPDGTDAQSLAVTGTTKGTNPAPPITNARITRQSVEAAQLAAFPADNVRITRQSVEIGQWQPYTLQNLRVSRQSVEVAQLGANNGFAEDAARLTQQTIEVLYLDPPADTTHDQDCYSRMRRL